MIEKYGVTTPEKGDGGVSDHPMEENSNDDDNEDMSDEESADMVEEELEALNSHLDKLGTALDKLEEKNDDIHAQLVELLEANRQVKMLFQDEASTNDEPSKQ